MIELCFEIGEAAKSRLDGVTEIAAWLAGERIEALLHNLPEHGVVHVAAAVIAHGRADVFRDLVDLCEQFLDGKLLKVRVRLQSLVEVGHIRAMVLAVVDLHRLCVNVWFECVKRIRERRQRVSHLGSSSLSSSMGHNVPPELQFLSHNYTRLAGKRGAGVSRR